MKYEPHRKWKDSQRKCKYSVVNTTVRVAFRENGIIQQPSLNLLLFGNQELADEQNKAVFIAVQEYIVKTKRFKIN